MPLDVDRRSNSRSRTASRCSSSGQPHPLGALRDRHLDQQTEMAAMLLRRRFAGDRRVRYLDLGDLVDLSDPERSFDRMHLTAPGNAIVATALVEPVRAMAAGRPLS